MNSFARRVNEKYLEIQSGDIRFGLGLKKGNYINLILTKSCTKMKEFFMKLIGCIFLILFFLSGCSSEKQVLGTWSDNNGRTYEFLSDHTGVAKFDYKKISGEKAFEVGVQMGLTAYSVENFRWKFLENNVVKVQLENNQVITFKLSDGVLTSSTNLKFKKLTN